MRILRAVSIGMFLQLIGFSNVATAMDICVAGSGDSEWDGTYNNNDAANVYVKDSSHFLYSDTFNWGFFTNSSGVGSPAYSTASNAGPDGNTFFVVLGNSPAPTVTSGTCSTTTTTSTSTTTTSSTTTTTTTTTTTSTTLAPTVSDPLPESVCLHVSDETSRKYAGTYNLTVGSSKTQSYKYVSASNSKLTIEPYALTDIIDSEVRSDGRLLYLNRYIKNHDYNEIPIGSYFSLIPLPDDSIYCPRDEDSEDIYISAGACTETESENSVRVAATSITGRVVASNTSQSQRILGSIPELEPGVVYALLFDGLTKEESTTQTPVGFTVVNSDGSYTFQKVLPGEYHIVFIGLDSVFSPSAVGVTVVGSDPAVADDATVTTITYADTGCTKKSVAEEMTKVNQKIVSYFTTVTSQLTRARDLVRKHVKGKKQAQLIKLIGTSQRKIDQNYGSILTLASTFPVIIRSSCPAAVKCAKKSLKKKISSLTSILNQMSDTEEKVFKSIRPELSKKKKEFVSLQKGTKAIASALKTSLQASGKLPSSHEDCAKVD